MRFSSRWLPWVVLILVPLPLFWPMLFGGHVFSGYYVNLYHYFFFAGQQQLAWHFHQLPLWWPAFYSGYPINLTLDGFLNPIFLIGLKYLSVITAYHWLTFGFFVANLFAMYVLARELGMTRAAGVLAAVTYGFSGIIIRWTDVVVFTSLFALLPLTFLSCLNISRNEKGWRWIWTALLVYGWIGGFAELVVYDLLAAAGWCLYLLLRDTPRPSAWDIIKKGARLYALPVALSILIVSPWLVTVFSFITTQSTRAGGLSIAEASSMPIGISHLIHAILPRVSVTYGDNIPVLNLGDDIDLFIAMTALLLLLALPFIWKSAKRGWVFFVGLLAFAVLMAFRSPVYLVLRHLPVLGWFRWHFKWLFLATFSAGLLAGYALDAFWAFYRHRWSKQFIIVLWILLGGAVAGSAVLALINHQAVEWMVRFGMDHYTRQAAASGRALPQSADYYTWIIRMMSSSFMNQFSLRNGLTAWTFVCWIIGLGAFSLPLLKKNISLTHQRWALVGAGILSVSVWWGFLTGFPNTYLTEEPATASFLKSRETTQTPYRIYEYFPDQSVSRLQEKYRISMVDHDNRALLTREMLSENIHSWFGIDSAVDHEPLTDARIAQLQNTVFGRTASSTLETLETQIAHFSTTSTAQLLGRMNVKYVLTPHELHEPWKQVFVSHVVNNTVPVFVYENPFFRTRWGFAEHALLTTHEEDQRMISDANPNTLLIESLSPSDTALTAATGTDDVLKTVAYGPGALSLHTHTAHARWIVFRETWMPYWQARVDSAVTSVYHADLGYQAVLVPPGDHDVTFTYLGFWEQARRALADLIRG